jgi:hypothetical protein
MTASTHDTHDRTNASIAMRRIVAAAVAFVVLAAAACAPRASHVDASSTPLGVSRCSEFACED